MDQFGHRLLNTLEEFTPTLSAGVCSLVRSTLGPPTFFRSYPPFYQLLSEGD